jgi:hypothetical protein
MEQSDYLGALIRGWWLIVIFGLAGLALGLVSPRHAIQTSFTTTSSVGTPPNGSSSGAVDHSADQILYYGSTDTVLDAASKAAGLNWQTWQVRAALSLLPPPDAIGAGSSGATSGQPGVVNVVVNAPTSSESLALNNAFDTALGNELASNATSSQIYGEQQTEAKMATILNDLATNKFPFGVTTQALGVEMTALENQLADLVISTPGSGYQVLHTPVLAEVNKVTTGATANSPKLRAAAGLLIGMALGALAAVGLWLLDRRLKTAKLTERAFGYPVVAQIPSDPSDSTEPYRMLWLSVFREPLPLPPVEGSEQLYEGESPVLDAGVGSRSGTQ